MQAAAQEIATLLRSLAMTVGFTGVPEIKLL